jgi:tRNA dimethylallyltransferase
VLDVIVIYGTTGSGKSSLALKMADTLDSPIISADSRKVYRDLDIATNKLKLKKAKEEGYEIYGIDCMDITERYNVYEFLTMCSEVFEKAREEDRIPIVVGGTVLYITALLNGYELRESSPDKKLRKILEDKNVEELQDRLKDNAQALWDKLNESERNNRRRLLRWIEIVESKGKYIDSKVAEEILNSKGEELIDIDNISFKDICIIPEQEKLEDRIEKRVERMIDKGLIEETKFLLKKYSEECRCFNFMGYKESLQYIRKEIEMKELKEELVREHLKYAKYQKRWIENKL